MGGAARINRRVSSGFPVKSTIKDKQRETTCGFSWDARPETDQGSSTSGIASTEAETFITHKRHAWIV